MLLFLLLFVLETRPRQVAVTECERSSGGLGLLSKALRSEDELKRIQSGKILCSGSDRSKGVRRLANKPPKRGLRF